MISICEQKFISEYFNQTVVTKLPSEHSAGLRPLFFLQRKYDLFSEAHSLPMILLAVHNSNEVKLIRYMAFDELPNV